MILVTGKSGFVGGKIMNVCKNTVGCQSLRGLTQDDICKIVDQSGADIIVHTAAISDIGACQSDPDASYYANVQIPIYLARAAKGRKLICFSSDQVYSGLEDGGPYDESVVKGANVYAEHKIEMENRVLDIDPNAVMLRAQWMYDLYFKKSNYFMNILNAKDEISFSSQQYRGIAYVQEVAENIENVAKLAGGAYNFGSETSKSMYEITKEFLEFIGKDICLEDAPKRHNLWLNCQKATKNGVVFSSVEDGLKKCAKDHKIV